MNKAVAVKPRMLTSMKNFMNEKSIELHQIMKV